MVVRRPLEPSSCALCLGLAAALPFQPTRDRRRQPDRRRHRQDTVHDLARARTVAPRVQRRRGASRLRQRTRSGATRVGLRQRRHRRRRAVPAAAKTRGPGCDRDPTRRSRAAARGKLRRDPVRRRPPALCARPRHRDCGRRRRARPRERVPAARGSIARARPEARFGRFRRDQWRRIRVAVVDPDAHRAGGGRGA